MSGRLVLKGRTGLIAVNDTNNTETTVIDTAGNVIGVVIPGDLSLANTHILVGNASAVAADVALSGDATIANTGVMTIANSAITDAKVAAAAAIALSKLAPLASGNIVVGSAGNVATAVAMSGDATIVASGALTIAAAAVTNAKIADSAGVGALGIRKSATMLWDFSVDGGVAGAITPVGSPTLPNKAVVWVESYDVLTSATSAASTATFKVNLPTDGDLTTAIAINDGSAPWTSGVFSRIAGGLATPLTKKTTATRVPQITIGVQNATAGKICFQLAYWVSG